MTHPHQSSLRAKPVHHFKTHLNITSSKNPFLSDTAISSFETPEYSTVNILKVMTYILTLFPVLNKLYYKPLCIPYLPQWRKFLFVKGCVCVIVFLSPYLTTALPTGGSQKMLIAHKSKWIIMKYPCYHSLFNNTSNWNPMPLCRYAWYSPTYRKLFLYSLYLPFPSLGGGKKKKEPL